ncbi:MAG: tRNA (adenosine(37)-N6)-dimethylallyltransferase MiaA [Clostridia bacterium]|nr:tRNA (adenosine(37)-N6)-dimethylallyltransferase MiaA [Clostridia bacterium]
MINKKPLVVIMGPTASGKTSLAVDICKKIGGEVITADSMQVYKKMNIGTAKPTIEEMQGIKHHMIDIVEPENSYSLADYVKDATQAIECVYENGNIPVLAGGTGLYIDTLINGVELNDSNNDENYRKELYDMAADKGNEAVHKLLAKIDIKSAENIHPNNLKRVIRALEFYKTTGIKQSEHISKGERNSLYNTCKFCLFPERNTLYEKINKRVDIMLMQGLVDEVKSLIDGGVSNVCTSMQGIGYKEIAMYLDNTISLSEAIELIKTGTRRYAKRQITWFKREEKTDFVDNTFGINLDYFVKSIELSFKI